MSPLALWAVAGASVAVLLIHVAYRCGRRRRPCVLPPALLQELAAHKLQCLGEKPDRVALELELLFGARSTTGWRHDDACGGSPPHSSVDSGTVTPSCSGSGAVAAAIGDPPGSAARAAATVRTMASR